MNNSPHPNAPTMLKHVIAYKDQRLLIFSTYSHRLMTKNTQTTEQLQCLISCGWQKIWLLSKLSFRKQNYIRMCSVLPVPLACRLLPQLSEKTTRGVLGYTAVSSLGPSACPFSVWEVWKEHKRSECSGCTLGGLHGDPSQWEMEQRFYYDHMSGGEQIA